VVGSINAPWAVDADNRYLPTRFEVHGDTLIQYTDTRGAAFPVVADPDVDWGIEIHVRFQRGEVKDFKAKGAFVGAAALMGVACGKIPIPWVLAPCVASVAIVGNSILDTFTKAANEDRCIDLQLNYEGIPVAWNTRKRGSWCK